ncbi:MAG: hypothetical protein ACRYFU_17105 [Janthinobacterium lividum]
MRPLAMAEHSLCVVKLGVATGTKRQDRAYRRPARHAVMDDDGPLVTTGGVTNAASFAVAGQHCFPVPTGVYLFIAVSAWDGSSENSKCENLVFPT